MMKKYRNLLINTARFVVDGQYEKTVTMFGHERLLYGSSFPMKYLSGGILLLKHAEISAESKEAIAGVNLLRVIRGWSA
jgi:predicted TIM-barrel fold metal-dependent hydrolase